MKHSGKARLLSFLLSLTIFVMNSSPALALQMKLPSALTVIEEQAFFGDTSITELVLPEGTKRIESKAFKACAALMYAVLPESIEYIADDAFDETGSPIMEVKTGSYAWRWAEDHGFTTYDPTSPAVDFVHYVDRLILDERVDHMDVASAIVDYAVPAGEAITWEVSRVENDGDAIFDVTVEPVSPDGSCAIVYVSNVQTAGEAVWRITAATPGDTRWSTVFRTVIMEKPDDFPNELILTDDEVTLKKGESYVLNVADELLNGAIPEELEIDWRFDSSACLDCETTETGAVYTLIDDSVESGVVTVSARVGGVIFTDEVTINVAPSAQGQLYLANSTLAIHDREVSSWVGDVMMHNCEPAEGEQVTWTVEAADEASEGYAELFFDPILDGGCLAGIRARNFSGAEGTATYVVKADAPGGYHYEEEFKVTFADYGEILPDGVSGPDGILTFNVGDTLTVSTDDIVANGSIPEELHVHKEFYVDELKEIAEWETLDDGSIRFTFTEAGTAAYGYAMFAGGVEFSCNVAVCVESSLIHHHLSNPILLTNWNGDSSFVGDFGVDLDHYLPADGEAVQWTVEPIDNEQPDLAEFYFKDMTSDENGVWMKLYADTNMFAEEGGTVQLRATATFPCGTVFDIEFSVEVVPLEGPWAQPSAYAEQRIYNWQKGEPFTANLSDISVLREENIPEGVDYQLELLPGELENLSSFQWGEDHQSFTFTPEETGLYRYEAALNVAGMQGKVPINVIVEETPFIYYSDYPTQVVNRKQGDTNQVGRFVLDVGIHGLIEEEVIEWSVAPVDDQQPELAQFEMDASGYSDGSTAHLKASSFTGAEGTVQLRVTAKFPGGTTFDYDVQVEVVDIPDENLPEAGVPAEVVYLDVGETYRLNVKDLYIDGDVPEGINTELWIDPYLIEHLSYEEYQYDASEGCFKDMVLTIANAGVYNFDVVLDFGGMSIPKRIILFVGPMASCYLSDEKIFANCEEGAVSFVGDFGIDLEHYQPKDGEAFVWTVEPIDENQPQLADFYFVDQTDNGTWVQLWANNFTGETGTVQLRAIATFPAGAPYNIDFTAEVVSEAAE